ncbi:MAG TPA: phospholipase D-like domain-containing protein [Dehalococcoidales bacterium]|nr:phospholipase D-like domain-containing protein [Dehalococcoidales bacterium]
MPANGLFGESDGAQEIQRGLSLDDGTGLRVVDARFLNEQKFDWDLFKDYDSLRVLTYSSSINAIVRMLDNYSFRSFECLFGHYGILRDMKEILAFQKVVVSDTRAAIMGLKDERHIYVLEKVHSGGARFYVLRKYIAHAKLYLLSGKGGCNRVIVGSANLSERAFSGTQPETLVKFDNDEKAWQHYNRMFDRIRDAAADEIDLPDSRISTAEIEISSTPVMTSSPSTLVIDAPSAEEIEISIPVQVERVEKVVAALGPTLSAALPPIRNGKQRITPEIKKEISRIRLVKSAEEADNRYFSLDRVNRTANLSGKLYPLDWKDDYARTDAGLILEYFTNYEGAFEGNVPRLQRDYFTLMSWLYFSPFMCDMRALALLQDSDIIRFPAFAIIFGKSNCGKTSLVDTLMTSMFGYSPVIEKQNFTTARLQALQQSYKRLPVVFDDIGRAAFRTHGRDMIKNELQPPVKEHPGFILSMNAEPQSFPDEVVKRSLMIYTATALPPHNEEMRQRLQSKVQEMRRRLTGHFYRCYLSRIMDQLESERLPQDWLALSSGTISGLIAEFTGEKLPDWCQPVTWLNYAEKRYDRVKSRLDSLLRPTSYARNESSLPNGWKMERDKVIVWEQRDAFGRRDFEWDDVPSTLIDEEASGNNRTVLQKAGLERFLGRRIRPPRRWWTPWSPSG